MEDRGISVGVLLIETVRCLLKYLLLATTLGVGALIAGLWLDFGEPVPIIVATAFTLLFFAAALTSSSVRAKGRIRIVDVAGSTVVFCFTWGAVVAALFLLAIQLWQGMEATSVNYLLAMAAAGLCCAVVGLIPKG